MAIHDPDSVSVALYRGVFVTFQSLQLAKAEIRSVRDYTLERI